MGLLPYNIKIKDKPNDYTIISKSIYLNFLCAFSLLLFISSVMVFHLRLINERVQDTPLTAGYTTQINYIAELIAILTFCYVTYICIFLNSQTCIKILCNIAKNIDALHKNNDTILIDIKNQVNAVMASLILLIVMQICVNFTRKDSFLKMCYVSITFNLPQTIQFSTIALFYILVISTVSIIKSIRKSIETNLADRKIISDGLRKVMPKYNYETIRQAEIGFTKASDIIENVNKVFEVPILITLAQCFHSTVSESHIIFYGAGVKHNLSIHDIINCSIWIVYQYLKVYVIASVGNKYKLEVVKIGKSILKLPTDKHELRFLLEIQHFSSLVNSPGNELTVCGYFTIDSTLFFKLVASTAMYFIILVQFDKGAD